VGRGEAKISALLQTESTYILTFIPPTQPSSGAFDLSITARVAGRDTTAAEARAVVYSSSPQQPVDVMLVLDRSGSMDGEAIGAAKDAAKLFIDFMAVGDRVGVASYSGTARVDYPLTTIVASSQPRVVWSDDGERGPSAWEADPPWSLTEETSSSSSHAWSDSPGRSYANNANVSLRTARPIPLDGLINPELAFKTKFDLERGFDYGLVEVSTDGGQSWLEVSRITGTQSTWREHRVGLERFRGLDILVRFRLVSDSSLTRDGWYIDDVVFRERVADIRQEAKTAVDAIVADGSTSIGAGLQAALQELQGGQLERSKFVVLLTDGKENTPPAVAQVLPNVIAAGIKVFTIALQGSEGVDDALLQDVAHRTGGRFLLTATPTDLRSIYTSVAGEVAGRETLFTADARISEGQQVSKSVLIDPSIREAVFSISWPNGSNRLRLTLEDPSGRIVDEEAARLDPQIELVKGSTYVYYRVQSPRPGEWQMNVAAEQVVTSTQAERAVAAALGIREPNEPRAAAVSTEMPETLEETVRFTVQASTPLTLHATADQTEYVTGDVIILTATASLEQPLTNLRVTAHVRQPNGQFRNLPLMLSDDGSAGDQAASDGVFTAQYSETTAPGTYQFFLHVTGNLENGNAFERETTVTVVVDLATDSDRDGMPDNWEISNGLDPHAPDSGEDPDGDALANLAEFNKGTKPLFADTDEDRLGDGDEVSLGTDPLNPDTDGGGELDGEEVLAGRNPLDAADDYKAPTPGSTPNPPAAPPSGGGGCAVTVRQPAAFPVVTALLILTVILAIRRLKGARWFQPK
jgi:hypothetical protein